MKQYDEIKAFKVQSTYYVYEIRYIAIWIVIKLINLHI